MRSSRVSSFAFVTGLALGAGGMQAAAASDCRVNGMPVSAVIADVADALSEATSGFRDGLAVANVSPLMPDDVIAVNGRLRKLSKPVGRVAEGVSALAKQRCFEQDAGGPGISPGYEFAIDLLVCGGVKDVLMKSASRLRSPRGFDAPPVMAGVIDAVDGACEAYKALIDRTVKWRFTRQPWKEVGIVEVDGQRCRRPKRAVSQRLV